MPKTQTKAASVVNVSKKKLITFIKGELKAAKKAENVGKKAADYSEADFQKTQGIVFDDMLDRIDSGEFDI